MIICDMSDYQSDFKIRHNVIRALINGLLTCQHYGCKFQPKLMSAGITMSKDPKSPAQKHNFYKLIP